MSALIVFGLAGFGYTSYTANSLACPADVVPQNSAASVWGIGCVGTGLGGAFFQSASGITLTRVSEHHDHLTAYNFLFFGYGIAAVIGLIILIFFMGPIVKNESLHSTIHWS